MAQAQFVDQSAHSPYSAIARRHGARDKLQLVFQELARQVEPQGNGLAFDPPESLITELSDYELSLILAVLESVWGHQIDYEGGLNIVMQKWRPSKHDYFPDEVVELMVRLAGARATDSVYCPFDGSLKLAKGASRVTSEVYFEASSFSQYPFLINILTGSSIKVRFGSDPVLEPEWVEGGQLTMFDLALANPRLGSRYKWESIIDLWDRFPERTVYGEVLNIRHVLSQTRRRAVVIVPNGLLFRTAAGQRQFKEHVVESGILESVIALPPALLTTTNLEFSLLVFNKERPSDRVTFVDARSVEFFSEGKGHLAIGKGSRSLKNIELIVKLHSEKKSGKFSAAVPHKVCAENDFNLLVERYITSQQQQQLDLLFEENKTASLEKLAEILRSQSFKADLDEQGEECFEVSVADIGEDGYILPPKKSIFISEKALGRVGSQILLPNDILLAVKGAVGRVGLVPEVHEGIWVPNQSFVVIRLKENSPIKAVVLFRYLSSRAGQALLQSRAGGTSIKSIQARDIQSLKVVVPSLQEQKAVLKEHAEITRIYREITRLRSQAEALMLKRWAM